MSQEEFVGQATTMYEKLRAWRASHPGASFDEIAEQVRQERQQLMGALLKELAEQAGSGEVLTERACLTCGGVLHYKGRRKRQVLHPEGIAGLERGYHYCDGCGHGFSPSGQSVAVGRAWVESRDAGESHSVRGGGIVV